VDGFAEPASALSMYPFMMFLPQGVDPDGQDPEEQSVERPVDAAPVGGHGGTRPGRIILLTTFRKQRNNERNEIDRAREAAVACAEQYP
jgi:hypothetical protein